MLRPGSVVQVRPPKILREIEREEAEEKPRHFQPENASDARERTQKASDAAAGCTGNLVGLFPRFPNIARAGDEAGRRGFNDSLGLRTTLGRGSRARLRSLYLALLSPLLGDAPGDAHSNAQSFAKLVRIHPILSLAAPKQNWFPTFVRLPSCSTRASEVR